MPGPDYWYTVSRAQWIVYKNLDPKPLFGAIGVDLAGPPQVWKEKHIRIAAKQGRRTVMIKGWNMAALAVEMQDAKAIDIAFEIERDWYGGWGLTARACRI